MNRKTTKICAGILAAAALSSSMLITAGAQSSELYGSSLKERSYEYGAELYAYQVRKGLATVSSKNTLSYTRPKVSINGAQASVRGLIINGTYYVAFRSVADALGASYSYNAGTRTGTMSASGLTFTSSDGCYVSYANDRTLFSITPSVLMSDGRLYIPANVFAKAIGMNIDYKNDTLSISGKYKAIASADKFYRSDEVLWLARIIHAESQGEPLLGQIAVGNVVLNRVRSSDFPNTIYSVIFDRKYGVQFSPILNGTIYNTPSYNSTLAAKICLEGYDVSEGALYFLQPRLSTSSWIPKNRDYAFSIGGHDFYK